ncbi:MAG TPA: glutamine-hydrolyzing GMP synthase [Thermoanaerobaculia bacterium]|jgi:GMP synthase (glutamine-hydrolysing)
MSGVAILDLGGQYCHLIGRRLRDLNVESTILGPETPAEDLEGYAGVILSGGPSSVYDPNSPQIDFKILDVGIPVLGICYGHQLLAQHLGARVAPGAGEYGLSTLSLIEVDSIFKGTPNRQKVWMSHSDSVADVPASFVRLARTDRCDVAAFAHLERRIFGVQFHPEVVHSEFGKEVLRNFALGVCCLKPEQGIATRVPKLQAEIRKKVGDRSVFFFVSGGVDSSVAFALCARALPRERILGVYVDTGLMRKGETDELRKNFARLGLIDRLRVRDESKRFLAKLDGVVEPEKKREIIGGLFVEVQSEAMKEYGIDEGRWLLGQGTIYPDTIESGGAAGRAAVIKTHHNRCAEILALMERGQVVEPLAEFYKDEVREIGRELGLDAHLTNRWPFPGPALAIRCLCTNIEGEPSVPPISLGAAYGDYEAVQVPLRSVGVQGDGRTYRELVALRGPLDYDRLQDLSSEICNANTLHNRVIVFLAGKKERLADARITNRALSPERLDTLREADYIARSAMEANGLMESVWQFPVILIPLTFGEGEAIVLRPVNSTDGMTANFARLEPGILASLAAKILAVDGVDMVFLDTTDKPPATIEWE